MSRPEQVRLPVVLVLGPDRAAISGVSTHLNLLFASGLGDRFRLRHFQVGSEGRGESRFARLARLLTSPFALAATLVAEQVDILHINTSLNRRAYLRDLMYMLVARLLGVRVLYQVHGGNLQHFSAGSRFLASMLHATLRLPDVIVVLSRCELESYHRLVPGQPVQLLPNGIDTGPYADLGQQQAGERGVLHLLYIGRLSRDKGLYEALQGLRLARTQGTAVHLTIAGGGPDEADLRREVTALQLDNDVSFAGPVFGDAKIKLLGSADVLLLPSYAEGLPYALLECMAAGVPAITTPVGAIPDVVVEGQHAVLVPPRDIEAIFRAITRLAADPGWLTQMSAACRKRIASHYSLQRLAGDFARLYAELGASPRSSAVTRS